MQKRADGRKKKKNHWASPTVAVTRGNVLLPLALVASIDQMIKLDCALIGICHSNYSSRMLVGIDSVLCIPSLTCL